MTVLNKQSKNDTKATQFDLWLKACDELGTKIYPLYRFDDNTALFKTWNVYEYKHNFYNTDPIYTIWIKGKRIMSTRDMYAAYARFQHELEELERNII